MVLKELSHYIIEQKAVRSAYLSRYVITDIYLPKYPPVGASLHLLLINDGQDLEEMHFSKMLNELKDTEQIEPLLAVGIHTNKDRKNEYGTAGRLDFQGRGNKAQAYERFIMQELIPFILLQYHIDTFKTMAMAGFSLGGLSAFDLVWRHRDNFSLVGVFSGSFWWRTKDLNDGYNDATDRIMHQIIKKGSYHPGIRFYFTTGSLDETADRNNNGVIDSIDDTLDLIKELVQIGYKGTEEIAYVNYPDGKHDLATWAEALPSFLLWGWALGVK